MENKKIRNATTCKGSGNFKSITFKSKLEKTIFKFLDEEGYHPQYEPKQFTLWEGFEPKTPFYDKETDSQYEKRGISDGKKLILKTAKVVGIRYTPDIYFKYGEYDIWVEVKGKENDVAYIKKKLFRKYLDDVMEKTGQKSYYFEVYNKKHIKQVIDILKNKTNENII